MPKINQEEYEVLKALDDKWKWIAREDEEPHNIAELIKEYEIETGMRYDFGKIKVVDIDTSKLATRNGYIYVNESEETEVKKDKKWFVDKWTKERNKTDVHDPMYHFINEFITDVNQLDEPEALSEGWIREHTWNNHYVGRPFIYADDLQNLLVPKQELPAIPKFVAEWISEHHERFDLYPALRRLEEGSTRDYDAYKWYRANTLKFVNAYLTGEYEIEKEREYYAKIKGHENIDSDDKYWNYCVTDGTLDIWDNKVHDDVLYEYVLSATKYDWNILGINDDNADFVEVEELEE